MTLHGKAREIVLDGVEYRWVIRKKAKYGSHLHIVVENAATGSVARFRFTAYRDEFAVTPKRVVELIRKALQAGWTSQALFELRDC